MSNRRRQTRTRTFTEEVSSHRWTLLRVGELGPEHLGRIVYTNHDRPEVPVGKRSMHAVGGTLVGFRPGEPSKFPAAGGRVLIIQQGGEGLRWAAALSDSVLVQS